MESVHCALCNSVQSVRELFDYFSSKYLWLSVINKIKNHSSNKTREHERDEDAISWQTTLNGVCGGRIVEYSSKIVCLHD